MITDFFTVIMTKNIKKQLEFYHEVLGLDVLFNNQDAIGLGKSERLFILLRSEQNENSHHLSEQKGPFIVNFICNGQVSTIEQKIIKSGFKHRETLDLPEYGKAYLFIEDADANEICLELNNT